MQSMKNASVGWRILPEPKTLGEAVQSTPDIGWRRTRESMPAMGELVPIAIRRIDGGLIRGYGFWIDEGAGPEWRTLTGVRIGSVAGWYSFNLRAMENFFNAEV